MSLSLLQHIELLPQIKYSFLGCIFPLLPAVTAEPGAPHIDSCYCLLSLKSPRDYEPFATKNLGGQDPGGG